MFQSPGTLEDTQIAVSSTIEQQNIAKQLVVLDISPPKLVKICTKGAHPHVSPFNVFHVARHFDAEGCFTGGPDMEEDVEDAACQTFSFTNPGGIWWDWVM